MILGEVNPSPDPDSQCIGTSCLGWCISESFKQQYILLDTIGHFPMILGDAKLQGCGKCQMMNIS